jgi:hypothetical protein
MTECVDFLFFAAPSRIMNASKRGNLIPDRIVCPFGSDWIRFQSRSRRLEREVALRRF